MKKLAAALLLLNIGCVFAQEEPAIQDNQQLICGPYTAFAINFVIGNIASKIEGDENFSQKWYNDAGLPLPDSPVLADPAATYYYHPGIYKNWIKKSQSPFQFGASIDLGYDFAASISLLVGLYVSFGFASKKSGEKIDGEVKEEESVIPPMNKDLYTSLLYDTINTTSFSLRAGVTLGYMMQEYLAVIYFKLGILKQDYDFHAAKAIAQFLPRIGAGADGLKGIFMQFDARNYKFNKVLPEFGFGLRKEFNNGFSVALEALYALGSKKDGLCLVFIDKKAIAALHGDAAAQLASHGGAINEADVRGIPESVKEKTANHKAMVNVLTLRAIARYTFKVA